MTQFANELDLMRDECIEVLSAGRAVTLKKRSKGTFDTVKGKYANTSTSVTITAIRGEDTNLSQGTSQRWQRVYMVDAATKLEADNAHMYTIVDGSMVWRVLSIRRSGDGRMMQVLTERTN
jgi:hypothetical protein